MIAIDEILAYAKRAQASDIHMTPGLPPKLRIHGSLETFPGNILTAEDTLETARFLLNEKQFSVFQEQGECDLALSIPGEGRYRANVFLRQGTTALALRSIPAQIPSPEELGLSSSIRNLYQKKRGLVLVTGPTGSGKSTTLAAIVDQINTCRDAHIITLEDPVEYLHPHKRSIVNQREIGPDTLSYANGLRAALREDPDVILVGEMRDYETISVAITAAETGHLVLSTLHTIGAASTVDRIIDVFPPHQQQQIRTQLSNVLEAVISQQLLPETDGKGRAAAFEVLCANTAVRNLIREGKSHQIPSIMQTSRRLGMISMDDAILELVREGKISSKTAVEFAQSPEEIEEKLSL